MKKLFLILAASFFALNQTSAQILVNGIYYTFSETVATVTSDENPSDGTPEYTGAISIPSQVTYNSQVYTVTSIGGNAFYGCSSLTSITIPNSITSIGGYAFYECSGLTSITIPNSVTSIGGFAFYNCDGLTSITIPNSVTSIGEWAFFECNGLISITIPNSVTNIGVQAFSSCTNLISISIPNSVTSIKQWAFAYCWNLAEIKVAWTNPISINSNVFDEVTTSDCTLKVPQGTIATYQAAPVWKNFNIVEHTVDIPATTPISPAMIKVNGNTLEIEGAPTGASIVVYDIIGHIIVKQITISQNVSIPIQNWNKGIYIVNLQTKTAKVSKKIIR